MVEASPCISQRKRERQTDRHTHAHTHTHTHTQTHSLGVQGFRRDLGFRGRRELG